MSTTVNSSFSSAAPLRPPPRRRAAAAIATGAAALTPELVLELLHERRPRPSGDMFLMKSFTCSRETSAIVLLLLQFGSRTWLVRV